MKKPLLLAAFLMGSASAVNLSDVSAKDVCFKQSISAIKIYPIGGEEYATPQQPLKVVNTLLEMGFVPGEKEDCEYHLNNYVTYDYSDFGNDYRLESFVFLEGNPTKENPYNYATSYMATKGGKYKDKRSFDDEISKIAESGYQQFIKDWKASHK
ncbi:hypothetical protein [Deinococcus sp. QL22]|uniref:hypothetical protein n=1 Tax=Deinococcus sp. QL22 TaxID=2939437 RepID=UPI0020182F26|nr:hypothetical protein [Deinococcus sp. QL22]UQN05351.1 hypothetical protein M1R55_10715 [Deinococcus sp. QL22]